MAGLSHDACRSRSIALDGRVRSEPVPCEAAALTAEEVNASETSRQAKLALAIREQRAEIIRHLYAMVLRRGQIVSLDEAARDWIPSHAATWRARHEGKLRD